jgi:hypothetical protein
MHEMPGVARIRCLLLLWIKLHLERTIPASQGCVTRRSSCWSSPTPRETPQTIDGARRSLSSKNFAQNHFSLPKSCVRFVTCRKYMQDALPSYDGVSSLGGRIGLETTNDDYWSPVVESSSSSPTEAAVVVVVVGFAFDLAAPFPTAAAPPAPWLSPVTRVFPRTSTSPSAPLALSSSDDGGSSSALPSLPSAAIRPFSRAKNRTMCGTRMLPRMSWRGCQHMTGSV